MIEICVSKSKKQILLERNGCVFSGQELLDNHEIDPRKECYCGRPLTNRRNSDSPSILNELFGKGFM